MDSIPQKRCTKCGKYFPPTTEYFEPRKDTLSGLRAHCRQCGRTQKNDYNSGRRDHLRTKAVKWIKDHPERKRELSKQDYEKHKPKRLIKHAEYRDKNKEHIRIQGKEYRERNADKIKIRRHKYHILNPHISRLNSRSRRAKLRGTGGKHTQQDIDLQFKSQMGKCWWCGNKLGNKYHADHLTPIARGGHNNANNIVLSCPHCNCSRQDKMPHEWIGRLL